MTGTAGCREIRQALGVYVLGAIDPAERSEVDEHLATCHDCREELAGLAGLPALLRRIPMDEAERLTLDGSESDGGAPSDELLPSLLSRAAAVKRSRKLRGLVAAAAAVALIFGGGGALAAQVLSPASQVSSSDHHHWHTVSGTSLVSGAHMTVRYTSMPWGTLMNVQVSGLEPGIACQLEVTDSTGKRWPVGGWTLTYHGQAPWYPASTSLPERDVSSFVLTSGGRVLATVTNTS